MKLSPLNQRRFDRFKAHKRGWWSLWLFLILFGLSLGAELIANDKPLAVRYDGQWYFPVLKRYPETVFGGEFPLQANYKSPYIQDLIAAKDGWMIWPPIPFSYSSINYDLEVPAPAPPSAQNWLGTDDQVRDVPTTPFTEPTIAVALAGEGAFLHRESVLDLLGLGQFNPSKVRVGTRRRVRRALPEWMELENRPDVPDEDLTHYEGIPATTVQRALEDMRDRMPPDRWGAVVDEALRRDLIGAQDATAWKAVSA